MTFISYMAILCASVGLCALMRRDAVAQSSGHPDYYVEPKQDLGHSPEPSEHKD